MNKLCCFQPIDHEYDRYQKYYLEGLLQSLDKREVTFHPYPLRPARFLALLGTRVSPISYLNTFAARLSKPNTAFYQRHKSHVGQYLLSFGGHQIKFAIDAHDHHEIRSPDILEWSNIYFKSNKWKNSRYPEKVLPIVNGNGVLSRARINELRSLRKTEKKIDLVFINRIWGGREHNVRIFEQLANLDCKKYLLAILPQKEDNQFKNRLDTVGVSCTFNTLPRRALWKILAQSRVVFLRAGKHLCIPWRMLDLLCMGSCIIYDSDPYPDWPVSLQNGENYVSCGIRRPKDSDVGPIDDYERIPQVIEEVLIDKSLQEKIHNNNIRYFDNHASPEKVADYVISCLNSYIE